MGRMMGIEPIYKIIWKGYFMKYKSKTFRNENFFVLYDTNDNIVSYFDNFSDLKKVLNYALNDLVHQYNRNNTDIITIIIGNKKYKLATFR